MRPGVGRRAVVRRGVEQVVLQFDVTGESAGVSVELVRDRTESERPDRFSRSVGSGRADEDRGDGATLGQRGVDERFVRFERAALDPKFAQIGDDAKGRTDFDRLAFFNERFF